MIAVIPLLEFVSLCYFQNFAAPAAVVLVVIDILLHCKNHKVLEIGIKKGCVDAFVDEK